jgi:plasmid stabilization system protein ParE
MRFEWSPEALRDIARLHRFLRSKNPRAADRAVATIRASLGLLLDFPEAGRMAADLNIDHRELLVPFSDGGYVVAYTIRDDVIEVLDIRHRAKPATDPPA